MAVNTSFYTTLNELMSRATGGTISAVVDYASFVDAGKVLSAMSISDLTNEFLTPLMNKVQKTINDNPSYQGSLIDMYKGKLDYGVLETIMGSFYSMAASTFDGNTITTGQTYTDQFTVNLPDKTVMYHTKSDSWELDITIRDTDLKGAFVSPQAMDAFIASIMVDVANSLELAKEDARLGVVSSMISYASGASANITDETKGAVNYNLLAIYNDKFSTSLTADDCLNNDSFVRFAVATIKDIKKLMGKPSTKFNRKSFKTFTPASKAKVKVNSLFEKAIQVSVIDAFNLENAVLGGEYETLPYWQNIDDRMRVTTNASGSTTYSPYVIACVYDDRAIGEMVQLEDTEATRNAKRKYTNYHWQENYMYWENQYANFVIFTIGSAT